MRLLLWTLITLIPLLHTTSGNAIEKQTKGLQAVIFDWAGTVQDYGCMAPVEVFKKVFEEQGVIITDAEARAPMGIHKKEHIRQIAFSSVVKGSDESVAERWQKVHGADPTDADVDAMFERFIPLQLETIREFTDLIPGTLQTVSYIRKCGWKVGSTTGYTQQLLDIVKEESAKRGYSPDVSIASDMVAKGRPAPDMVLAACEQLQVNPTYVVKIDDTLPGIIEGREAGCWTIQVLLSGSEVGLPYSQIQLLSKQELTALYYQTEANVEKKAHFRIATIADAPAVLDKIDQLVRRGYTPDKYYSETKMSGIE
jgi:phosphonoacetaldehyde hydrolase